MSFGFRCGWFVLWIGVSVPIATAQPTTQGEWSGVIDWPIEAIHAAMLPTGKVMIWQTWTQSVGLWDPATQQFSQPAIPNVNIFCAGHAWLPDGRLMVMGGHINNSVGEPDGNIYDPFTDSWANNVAPMNAPRWYPSATTLGDGRVLTLSGDRNGPGDTNPLPQIYDPTTNSWQDLTAAQKVLPLYPRTMLAPNGDVVVLSTYQETTESLNTQGTGSWSFIDNPLLPNLYNYGPAVMYDAGKVAFIGGGDNPTANVSLMDLNDTNPQWRFANEAMAQPRRQNDATILADGTILITGGSSLPGFNDPAGRVSTTEIFDPDTETITQVAEASSVYRGYHTTATLLPDGRVLVTGGDHTDGTGGVQNLNAEIYSPAYLFRGARPEVTQVPSNAELGTTFFVATPDAESIEDITFIVPGATTHAQNWTQRANRLDFAVVDGGLNVVLPANPNAAPPGYYMMFLVDADGVPSVGEFVRADLPTSLRGDFDSDGNYACADVDNLVADIAAGTHTAAFDLDGDGLVTATDLDRWLATAGAANLPSGAAYLPGDANLDGVVDGQDFVVWNDHKFSSTSAWCSGDFNADGQVDGVDFIIWNDNKFQTADAASVPEPLGGAWFLVVLCTGRIKRYCNPS